MRFTPDEIEMIRGAQDYGRRLKGQEKTITCPFLEANPFNRDSICKLCFRWMRISDKYEINTIGHPCNTIHPDTIRQLFWRNPKLDESV